MYDFHNIPDELKARPQWVLWKTEERNEKKTKIPYQITGRKAASNKAQTWDTYDKTLREYHKGGFDGIGFVFFSFDDFCGIDLDDCRNPETEEIETWAQKIIDLYSSYSEISPSKTGVKIFIKGEMPGGKGHKIVYETGGIEAYSEGRFFTMTGWKLPESESELNPAQKILDRMCEKLFTNDNTHPKSTNNKPLDSEINDLKRLEKYKSKIDKSIKLYILECVDNHSQGRATQRHVAIYKLACTLAGYKFKQHDILNLTLSFCTQLDNELAQRDIETTPKTTEEIQKQVQNAIDFNNREKYKKTDYPQSESGNAQRFVDQYKDKVRFNHTSNKWHIWNTKRWKEDDTRKIEAIMREVINDMFHEVVKVEGDAAKKKLTQFIHSSLRYKNYRDVLEHCKSIQEISIKTNQFDQKSYFLNLKNGTLDLMNGFGEHRQKDNITKIIDINYDESKECPLWISFLMDIFDADLDLIGYVKRCVGLSLSADVTAQCLFFCFGTGKNGKSTFFDVLVPLMGDYFQKAPADMLLQKQNGGGIPNDIARLAGKRFVVASELDQGRRFAEATIKDLTGGDIVAARFMRGEYFEFKPTHKLWIYGNHKPIIKNNDEGMWRRLMVIPFTQYIEEEKRDVNLAQKMKKELPGILNWAIEGFNEWREKGGLYPPEIVKAESMKYRNEMDKIRFFLEECCDVSDEKSEKFKEVFETYKRWDSRPMGRSTFKKQLEERGFFVNRMNDNVMTVNGISLLSEYKIHPYG